MNIEEPTSKWLLWSPLLVVLILVSGLFWWNQGQKQDQIETFIKVWHFEHCTPTNKDCGRLEQ